jgi:hypothetical protein
MKEGDVGCLIFQSDLGNGLEVSFSWGLATYRGLVTSDVGRRGNSTSNEHQGVGGLAWKKTTPMRNGGAIIVVDIIPV